MPPFRLSRRGLLAGYALLLAGTALFIQLRLRERSAIHAATRDRATGYARILADSSAPGLVFGDVAAVEGAYAPLVSEPSFLHVGIRDRAGAVVSARGRHDAEGTADQIHVSAPVIDVAGRTIGTAHLVLSTRNITEQARAVDIMSALFLATQLLGGSFILRAVRDQARTREQLVRSDRLASVGRLATSVAHEINNPLTYVLANLRFVAEDFRSNRGSSPKIPEGFEQSPSASLRAPAHERGRSPHACQMAVM